MNESSSQYWQKPLRACLLIGGRSSRMGHPKHLIKGKNGLTWVENTVQLLQPLTRDIVLSGVGTVPDSLQSLQRISDVPEAKGPLTGILAAMRWHPDSCWLLLACDMPNISMDALKWLLGNRSADSWGTVPKLKKNGFVEPLLALYEPQSQKYFEELCETECFQISMVARQPEIKTPIIPQALRTAWSNINTPDELSKLLDCGQGHSATKMGAEDNVI